MNNQYLLWMKEAIKEAKKSEKKDEVPIGAIAILDNKIIARAHNIREKNNDPIGHAEILLIKKASKKINSWRLNNVVLCVTCEPCLMCAGAIMQSRVSKLIYGCSDPEYGASKLLCNVEVIKGMLADDCAKLLKDFFKNKRGRM